MREFAGGGDFTETYEFTPTCDFIHPVKSQDVACVISHTTVAFHTPTYAKKHPRRISWNRSRFPRSIKFPPDCSNVLLSLSWARLGCTSIVLTNTTYPKSPPNASETPQGREGGTQKQQHNRAHETRALNWSVRLREPSFTPN